MERLKAFSVEKFTLDGRKFHTLTILSQFSLNKKETRKATQPRLPEAKRVENDASARPPNLSLASHRKLYCYNSPAPTVSDPQS